MSQHQPDHTVIMFADVSGSTQLYERLGDAAAHRCVSESLARIVSHARNHDGRLVETIGDEAMLSFSRIDQAAMAAICMQQHFFAEPVTKQHFIKIRIGFHFGPIEYDAGHPFGDTVNVAARVASLCEAGRIIATDTTINSLANPAEFQLRPYQTARVKGKSQLIRVQEIVWDNEDCTSMLNPTQLTQLTQLEHPPLQLQLYYLGRELQLDVDAGPFMIGRDPHCDLVIDSALASRNHARIEFRWGEVILTDHSTNGTFVEGQKGKREGDGVAVRLHRREMALQGTGKIGIGIQISEAEAVSLLGYRLEQH